MKQYIKVINHSRNEELIGLVIDKKNFYAIVVIKSCDYYILGQSCTILDDDIITPMSENEVVVESI